MKTSLKVLLCAFLLPAAVGAGVLHVSPAGNDENPGKADSPLATIARAAALARPGDTVKIAPGLYREQITFRRSGRLGAPVTFEGTRGSKGEFLTVVEPPGKSLDKWTPAPEIGKNVWKTPLEKRPDLVLMDGLRIVFINKETMALPRWKSLPSKLDEKMLWGKFGPGCTRLPGFDLLCLPADIKQKHQYFRGRKEFFWPVVGNVLSGWDKGFVYVRCADGQTPDRHRFSASAGFGFTVEASHLTFKDLFMRGSRIQICVKPESSGITVDSCLLMHGNMRIRFEEGAANCTVKNSILTAGFIRGDLFGLRSDDDMRGGLLYLVFKYIIGTSTSDDAGVKDYGTGSKIHGNIIVRGLIGINAWGPGSDICGNVVREMSSVGISTGPRTVCRCHHNLVMNCGIPLRVHALRHERAKREEHHYGSLFVQARHSGRQIFVHSDSHRIGPDRVNFIPGTDKMKEDPPAPVDAGKIHIYHNTFWGGDEAYPSFTVAYHSKRLRMSLPFFLVNNIVKDSPRFDTRTHDLAGPNVLYTFGKEIKLTDRRGPAIPKVNRILDRKATERLWNRNNLPGLPDLSLAPGSPALGAGVDVSKPFTVNGKTFPALPGFAPGYFKGPAPAAGALQEGESFRRFADMHRRAEAAVRMIAELSRNEAPGKGK